MKVVFHADDFGLTPGINAGIVEGYERGVLGSTSLMMTAPAWEDAVRLARATPGLDIGVHLTLVEERPALPPDRVPSLVAGERFWPTHGAVGLRWLLGRWRAAEARVELAAQLARFDATGLIASHLDGHQHLHLLPGVFGWVVAEARRRGIRFVRSTLAEPRAGGSAVRAAIQAGLRGLARIGRRALAPADRAAVVPFATVGFLHAGGTLDRAGLLGVLERLRRGGATLVEVMLHPGRPDDDARRRYGHWRYQWGNDLDLLLDPALPDALARGGMQVTSFRALAADAHG